MKSEDTHLSEAELDQLFDIARRDVPQPSRNLLARIQADGFEEQSFNEAKSYEKPSSGAETRRPGFLGRRINLSLLAWPTGLAASCLLGIALGGWAETGGYLYDTPVLESAFVYEIAYQVPSLAGLLEGI